MASDLPTPRQLAGIRNFAWLVPGKLTRGEQPPLDQTTFEALRSEGIGAVLSLRQDEEEERVLAGRVVPAYSVQEERAWCERYGLSFRHVGCTDFQAPPPDEVALVLTAIDEEVGAGRALLVHCMAGVGRTSVAAGAWLIAQGASGNEAAAIHARFVRELDDRLEIAPQLRERYFQRVGRGYSRWGFRAIADALGSPITGDFGMPTPERPPGAEGWEEWYRQALKPWRRA